MAQKNKLFVIGYSHSFRLLQQIQNNPKYTDNFEIKDFTRRGARFATLKLPEPELFQSGDVIVAQLFGNDIVAGRRIRSIENNQVKYHLTNVILTPQTKLDQMYEKLSQYFHQLPDVKILLIDHIRRFFCGCQHHVDPRLARHQNKQFKKLRDAFLSNTNVLVLDHRRLINENYQRLRNSTVEYMKLLTDNIHLHREHYAYMAEKVHVEYLQ